LVTGQIQAVIRSVMHTIHRVIHIEMTDFVGVMPVFSHFSARSPTYPHFYVVNIPRSFMHISE